MDLTMALAKVAGMKPRIDDILKSSTYDEHEKPATPAVRLQRKKLNEYFPADYSAEQMEEVIYELLKRWSFEQGNRQEG